MPGRRGCCSTLAEALIETIIGELRDTPGLISIEPAGSFRRRRETIGDLDLLAETTDPDALVARFTGLASVDRVLVPGPHKAAVRLLRGPQVDLMIMPPDTAGTYLIHFTGAKDHNVRLRGMARDRGWSLSENGFLRIGEDGKPLTGDEAELPPSRPRPRPTASSTWRSSSRSCARTGARSRPPRRGTLPELVTCPTCGATCTPIRTGRTASTRSRRWPRPHGIAAMPTRS